MKAANDEPRPHASFTEFQCDAALESNPAAVGGLVNRMSVAHGDR